MRLEIAFCRKKARIHSHRVLVARGVEWSTRAAAPEPREAVVALVKAEGTLSSTGQLRREQFQCLTQMSWMMQKRPMRKKEKRKTRLSQTMMAMSLWTVRTTTTAGIVLIVRGVWSTTTITVQGQYATTITAITMGIGIGAGSW